ncbi:hypothetical protein ML401_38865 [Bradyrhizobium sp. 62B]|nr:hypothetical protein ML401_38865 [Bradyrhizobium sp. 62B]
MNLARGDPSVEPQLELPPVNCWQYEQVLVNFSDKSPFRMSGFDSVSLTHFSMPCATAELATVSNIIVAIAFGKIGYIEPLNMSLKKMKCAAI